MRKYSELWIEGGGKGRCSRHHQFSCSTKRIAMSSPTPINYQICTFNFCLTKIKLHKSLRITIFFSVVFSLHATHSIAIWVWPRSVFFVVYCCLWHDSDINVKFVGINYYFCGGSWMCCRYCTGQRLIQCTAAEGMCDGVYVLFSLSAWIFVRPWTSFGRYQSLKSIIINFFEIIHPTIN